MRSAAIPCVLRAVPDVADGGRVSIMIMTAFLSRALGSAFMIHPSQSCDRPKSQLHLDPQCTQCRTGHWSVSPRSGTAVPSAQTPCGTECPVPGQCRRLALHSVQQCRPVPQIRLALSAQCRTAELVGVPLPLQLLFISNE